MVWDWHRGLRYFGQKSNVVGIHEDAERQLGMWGQKHCTPKYNLIGASIVNQEFSFKSFWANYTFMSRHQKFTLNEYVLDSVPTWKAVISLKWKVLRSSKDRTFFSEGPVSLIEWICKQPQANAKYASITRLSAWLGQVLKTDIIISSMMLFHTNTIHSFGFSLGESTQLVWGSRRVYDYKDHSLTHFNFFTIPQNKCIVVFLAV